MSSKKIEAVSLFAIKMFLIKITYVRAVRERSQQQKCRIRCASDKADCAIREFRGGVNSDDTLVGRTLVLSACSLCLARLTRQLHPEPQRKATKIFYLLYYVQYSV